MASTTRFLRQYLRPAPAAVASSQTVYSRGAMDLPATLYRPAGDPRPLPGWVVLHGLTRTGRSHPSLVRFAEALASGGNVVLVPEIPEWCELRVAPALTVGTIREAVRSLQQRSDVLHEHVGLIGFSFGATQALNAIADPDTASLVSGVAAWGGYHDLRRMFRFGLTGLHEMDGVTYQTSPDPYGSWIMAGNYLPLIPGYSGSEPVADALHSLALEAGERGNYAWDPIYDPSKVRLRASLSPGHRELFDLIAPETTVTVRDTQKLLDLAEDLAATAVLADPLLDPVPQLPDVRTPVLFAHGRDDRLVPFSETLHLARAVPPQYVDSVTITSLFQHSGGTQSGLNPVRLTREAGRFVLLLRRLLRLI